MDASAWDLRYTEQPQPFGRTPNATLVAALAGLRPGRAIDLACGDGRHAAWLADRGWQVDAVDFSAAAIEAARAAGQEEDHRTERIRWYVDDALSWDPPTRVDLVLVAYLQVERLDLALGRARTWLAPGGRLVYLGHARENLAYGVGGPRDAEVLPTPTSLAAALDGMQIETLHHVVRATGAGDAYDVLAVAGEFEG
ncbi:methyltransferase family protein [Mumia flava]|uniref:Methyltransferase family protein n=1 Tax=Mumia flava TaxID=1348852 RepID=A0A0B2B8K1_9ACTN|nr:class I SAM-dependent methyltransferase [Mumia flava]PJJ56803.1 methyltransferase family protein [Mumia flava]